MLRERGWTSLTVWLVLLAFAFACGVLVVGQAFELRVPTLTGRSLRLSADYSADPRLVREQKIAPVDSAVISDTVNDLIVEQTEAPLLILAQTPILIAPTPRPVGVPIRPTATATLPLASVIAAATAENHAPAATAASIAAPPDERGPSSARPTRSPTRTPLRPPVATLRPVAAPTTRPLVVPSNTPVRPTNTPVPPTDTPVPPT
ncbi:MAG TPA: hypothetical protein VKE41_06825, partial [Roseiflexaceae bacterium]|nr:hypothetical protein [Roseiflexaceae bacterium]